MARAEPRRRRIPLAVPAAVLSALLAAPAVAAPFDLPALMALLARHGDGQARFTEQRFVAGLAQPLLSSGTLEFAAPDHFVRRTLQPRAESLEVDGNRLVMRRGGRSRTVALDSVPEAAASIGALRGTLTGDAAALQKDFVAHVSGDAAHWTLALDPRDAQAQPALRIEGAGDALQRVETRLPGGDRSVMTIEPAAATAPASAPSP